VPRLQESAVRGPRRPPEYRLAQAAAVDGAPANVERQNRQPHFRERFRQKRRADRLGVLAAAEVERILPQAHRDQAQRHQVAEEIQDVAAVVVETHPRDHLVEHGLDLDRGEACGPAHTDVEVDVLHQRREHDSPVDERLEDKIARFLAELPANLVALRRVAQEPASDVDGAVRPRRHRQVLDDLGDSLVPVDEDDVAGTDAALESLRVVEDVAPVFGAGARDAPDEPFPEQLAGGTHCNHCALGREILPVIPRSAATRDPELIEPGIPRCARDDS
jgi:hypothetical protein